MNKKPKTFNWTKKRYKKVKGAYEMSCFYTRSNGKPHCLTCVTQKADIKKTKALIESQSHAIAGGAWEYTQDAMLQFHEGKAQVPRKYIKMLA